MNKLTILFFILSVIATKPINSHGTTIDFENVADGTYITNQYTNDNILFSGSTVIKSGISLNEFEFPPYSGENVLFDEYGPILINFLSPINTISGYFSYSTKITITGYGSSGNLIGISTSNFNSNMALSGDYGSSPNEFIQLSLYNDIYSIIITGDYSGNSFTLDDLSFYSNYQSVPEPGSVFLFTTGLICLYLTRKNIFQHYMIS